MSFSLEASLYELHAVDPTLAVCAALGFDKIPDDVVTSFDLAIAIGEARTYLYNGNFIDCKNCGWVFPDKEEQHHASCIAPELDIIDDQSDNPDAQLGYPDDEEETDPADLAEYLHGRANEMY